MTQRLNRREWLTATGLATLAACAHNKGTGFYGYGLVANAGDNSLAAVDLTQFKLASSIELDAAPSQLIGAPEPYVLTPSTGTVHLIDQQLKRKTWYRLSDHVSRIGLAGDCNSLLALAPHARQLIQADLRSLRPIARHKISFQSPTAIDFSSTGYAALANSAGDVELIHLGTGARTHTQTPALGPIRFRKDGKVLLTANLQNSSLLILDVPTLKVIAELPLAMMPDQLCFNADQGQLFVSGRGMDGVAVVFPYKDMEVDQTLLAGRDPGTMACSETPAYLFVGSNTGSDVCILNIDTRKVIAFVQMGGRPTFITVTPDSQYALVLNEAAGAMGVIHVRDIRSNRLKNGAALFTMLSVGSRPVDLVVVPRSV